MGGEDGGEATHSATTTHSTTHSFNHSFNHSACPSRASELQAIMALRASDAILEKNLAIIRRNLALLDEFMGRYSELFEWIRPKAGAIAFIKVGVFWWSLASRANETSAKLKASDSSFACLVCPFFYKTLDTTGYHKTGYHDVSSKGR